MGESDDHEALRARIAALEQENAALRARLFTPTEPTVRVPPAMADVFGQAQRLVGESFERFSADPSRAQIEIDGERYVLVRAGALSYEFLTAIAGLYADRGEAEALHVGRNMLFDIAHLLGISDARRFHERMGLEDPIAKLSAGPVHFAYTGWALVELLPESQPSVDDECKLLYHHPYSFEAEAWLRAGRASDSPVCIMNSGYSSGWCEASFGIPLTAVEITCRARGDAECSFVMAPPHRIQERLDELAPAVTSAPRTGSYEIPTFFERKETEERLRDAYARAEASNRAKTEFLAKTSHELRTPLFGVTGMTELLLRTPLSDVQREYAEAVEASGRTLLALVNDLLDLSKVESGRLELEATDFAIDSLLRSAAETIRPRASERGLTVVVEATPDVPTWVRGDSTRVRQILLNFLANAVRFTDAGTISIRAERAEGGEGLARVRLSVRDTGIGVAPEDQEAIFESFVQRPRPGQRIATGTGLGLAISKRLASLMNGSVGVSSEVGVGSTFWVDLPLAPVAPPTSPRARDAQPARSSRLRILVAEDNHLNQRMVQAVLEHAGHQVTVVGDGAAALEATTAASNADEPYDLVLMDLQMPDMDGLEATRRLRAEGNSTPIVALTAHALEGFREQCFGAGMNGYLTKPIDPDQLCQLVEELVCV